MCQVHEKNTKTIARQIIHVRINLTSAYYLHIIENVMFKIE